jgi:hypothetical protein
MINRGGGIPPPAARSWRTSSRFSCEGAGAVGRQKTRCGRGASTAWRAAAVPAEGHQVDRAHACCVYRGSDETTTAEGQRLLYHHVAHLSSALPTADVLRPAAFDETFAQGGSIL